MDLNPRLVFASLFALASCGGGPPRNEMSAIFFNGSSKLIAEYTEVECEFSVHPDYVSLAVRLSSPPQGPDTTNTLSMTVTESDPGPSFSQDATVRMSLLFSQLTLNHYHVQENLAWVPSDASPDLTALTVGQEVPVEGALRITQDTVLAPTEGGLRSMPAQDIVFSCDATVSLADEPT